MAVSFNGTTDLIDMGTGAGSLQLANNAPMSMCCWVNFASFTGTQTFLGYGFNSGDTGYYFQTTGVGGGISLLQPLPEERLTALPGPASHGLRIRGIIAMAIMMAAIGGFILMAHQSLGRLRILVQFL